MGFKLHDPDGHIRLELILQNQYVPWTSVFVSAQTPSYSAFVSPFALNALNDERFVLLLATLLTIYSVVDSRVRSLTVCGCRICRIMNFNEIKVNLSLLSGNQYA